MAQGRSDSVPDLPVGLTQSWIPCCSMVISRIAMAVKGSEPTVEANRAMMPWMRSRNAS
ncbi:hypothetical protein JCM18918_3525 [Cutibacterium acnes JCM 18918]|nr:hypothetical protein JCM18918_3525 [Cutibacterium acnes JCM 18918]